MLDRSHSAQKSERHRDRVDPETGDKRTGCPNTPPLEALYNRGGGPRNPSRKLVLICANRQTQLGLAAGIWHLYDVPGNYNTQSIGTLNPQYFPNQVRPSILNGVHPNPENPAHWLSPPAAFSPSSTAGAIANVAHLTMHDGGSLLNGSQCGAHSFKINYKEQHRMVGNKGPRSCRNPFRHNARTERIWPLCYADNSGRMVRIHCLRFMHKLTPDRRNYSWTIKAFGSKFPNGQWKELKAREPLYFHTTGPHVQPVAGLVQAFYEIYTQALNAIIPGSVPTPGPARYDSTGAFLGAEADPEVKTYTPLQPLSSLLALIK